MRTWRHAAAVLLLVLWAAAAIQAQEKNGGAYRVGVGDLIEVTTFQQEEVSGDFLVEETGAVTFPMLGAVPVAGKTTSEIAALLEQLLEKDYYVDVQLKVEVKEYASKPVTLLGEVQKPGTYYLEGRTTITELLAKAGGLAQTAGPTIELRRPQAEGETTGPQVMVFSTAGVLTGEEGRDVVLEAGDVLSVSAKKMFFITGEIARPGRYEISLGMTLMQAISEGGGLDKFASQAIEIHREVDGEKRILSLDLSHIRKGKTPDPQILPGDVIIVKRRFF